MRWIVPLCLIVLLPGSAAIGQDINHAAGKPDVMPMHTHAMPGAAGSLPTQPGQDAFGAVQEIVGMLQADPSTDWSKVNLDALREHLIDMNEVALRADAAVERIDGGIRVVVTGSGRTLAAIQRMLPEHTREMNGRNGWTMQAEPRADGVTLTVTATDQRQIAIIRGLGFIGVMATGGHHQMHHLMMAKGAL
jgi:hypothetical protein